MKHFWLSIVTLFSTCSFATADFFVSVGEAGPTMPSFVAGTTGTISVYGRHNETNSIALDGVQLALDFAPIGGAANGVGLPTGISAPFSGGNSVFGTGVNVTVPANRNNFDVLVSTAKSGQPFSFATNTTVKLFDISFAIASDAAPGIYGIFLNPNGTVGLGNADANDIAYDGGNSYGIAGNNDLAFTAIGFQNQFTITAVPEPSSMVLATLAILGGAGIHRRFRKKSAA